MLERLRAAKGLVVYAWRRKKTSLKMSQLVRICLVGSSDQKLCPIVSLYAMTVAAACVSIGSPEDVMVTDKINAPRPLHPPPRISK